MSGGMPFNFNTVTADTADAVQASYKAKQKEKAKGPAEEEKRGPGRPPKPAPEVQATKQDLRVMNKVIDSRIAEDREEKKAKNEASRQQKLIDEAADNLIRVEDYKRHFPELFKHLDVPKNPTPTEIASVLAQMRKTLNSFGAEDMFDKAVPRLFSGVEELHYHFNPMGWNLTGLGRVFSDPEAMGALETEITEIKIETKPWLASSCYTRALVKFGCILKAYSDANTAQAESYQRSRGTTTASTAQVQDSVKEEV